jgi:hypothetical protein
MFPQPILWIKNTKFQWTLCFPQSIPSNPHKKQRLEFIIFPHYYTTHHINSSLFAPNLTQKSTIFSANAKNGHHNAVSAVTFSKTGREVDGKSKRRNKEHAVSRNTYVAGNRQPAATGWSVNGFEAHVHNASSDPKPPHSRTSAQCVLSNLPHPCRYGGTPVGMHDTKESFLACVLSNVRLLPRHFTCPIVQPKFV